MTGLPLEGTRVIDLTQVWAGPALGAYLGDMGAEVIRVESMAGTDLLRRNQAQHTGQEKSEFRTLLDSQWHYRNRRYYLTLNLASSEGLDLFHDLVRQSDVVLQNFSPMTAQRFGLTFESLKRIRPDVIVASISAAGQDGPWHDLLGFGPSVNAIAGTNGLVGYPDDDGKLMMSIWDPDPAMGVMASYAVMTALFRRGRTGQGQQVDLPFTEFLPSLLGEPVLERQMNGRMPKPMGNLHPRLVPHNVFPCIEPETWVSIAVQTEEEWRGLCEAMGKPELQRDPRFSDLRHRLDNREAIEGIVGDWTRGRTSGQVTETLQAAGVAAAPAFSVAELYHDPHDQYLRSTVHIDTPGLPPEALTYGIPWRLSETPGSVRYLGRDPGQDNEELFGEVLGLSEAEIERLVEQGAIY